MNPDRLRDLIDERDRRYAELRAADRDAIQAALAAAKEAVALAEQNAERWRASANEWRGAMSDRERDFVRRSEIRGYLIALLSALISVGIAIAAIVTR